MYVVSLLIFLSHYYLVYLLLSVFTRISKLKLYDLLLLLLYDI